MPPSDFGMNVADFNDNPLADFGVTVGWENSTKTTDNVTGEESLSYAASVNKTVVFLKRSASFEQSHEGLLESGDAYIMATTTDGFAKDDRITYETRKYLITNVIRRNPGGVAMFDFCTLKLTE